MSTDKRIIAGYAEDRSIGARLGGGGPVTITGLQAVGGPKQSMDRYVDLCFASQIDAREFARSILRFVGDPE